MLSIWTAAFWKTSPTWPKYLFKVCMSNFSIRATVVFCLILNFVSSFTWLVLFLFSNKPKVQQCKTQQLAVSTVYVKQGILILPEI